MRILFFFLTILIVTIYLFQSAYQFSPEGSVSVSSAPKITKNLPERTILLENQTMKFEVQVIGHPKPSTRWSMQGNEIHSSEEYQIENFEDGTSILIINEVYPDDVGEIKFEAQNSFGVAKTVTEFCVGGKYFFFNSCLKES